MASTPAVSNGVAGASGAGAGGGGAPPSTRRSKKGLDFFRRLLQPGTRSSQGGAADAAGHHQPHHQPSQPRLSVTSAANLPDSPLPPPQASVPWYAGRLPHYHPPHPPPPPLSASSRGHPPLSPSSPHISSDEGVIVTEGVDVGDLTDPNTRDSDASHPLERLADSSTRTLADVLDSVRDEHHKTSPADTDFRDPALHHERLALSPHSGGRAGGGRGSGGAWKAQHATVHQHQLAGRAVDMMEDDSETASGVGGLDDVGGDSSDDEREARPGCLNDRCSREKRRLLKMVEKLKQEVSWVGCGA